MDAEQQQRELRAKFKPSLALIVMGKDHIPIYLPDFLTMWFKEEWQKQMKWIRSACQQLIISIRTYSLNITWNWAVSMSWQSRDCHMVSQKPLQICCNTDSYWRSFLPSASPASMAHWRYLDNMSSFLYSYVWLLCNIFQLLNEAIVMNYKK